MREYRASAIVIIVALAPFLQHINGGVLEPREDTCLDMQLRAVLAARGNTVPQPVVRLANVHVSKRLSIAQLAALTTTAALLNAMSFKGGGNEALCSSPETPQ